MKKKIKLHAYRSFSDGEVVRLDIERAQYKPSADYYEPAPEWDEEREIELPDEPMKARECTFHVTSAGNEPSSWGVSWAKDCVFDAGQSDIKMREVIPGHITINKDKLISFWEKGIFNQSALTFEGFLEYLEASEGEE